MRKVTFGGANSLDNFFARKDDSVDWLLWDKEVGSIMKEFWKTIDTVVMGRRTYEVVMKSSTAGYPGVKNYVFSRTLKKARTKESKSFRKMRPNLCAALRNRRAKTSASSAVGF